VVKAVPRRLAVVCIIRNAAGYIGEWLDFHLAAGVDHVIVYDNHSDDETRAILLARRKDQITIVPWALEGCDEGTDRYLSRQVSAYAHALTTFGGDFERMAFIDVDEFLVPVGHASLTEALDVIGDHSNISLPWLMFGHSGHDTRPEGGVIANYTERAVTPYGRRSPLLRFKCIVRPPRVSTVGIHRFRTVDMGDKSANTRNEVASNDARKQAEFFATENIQLNHYYALSRHDAETKMARGPVANASQSGYAARVQSKITEIERATTTDRTAIDYLARHGERQIMRS